MQLFIQDERLNISPAYLRPGGPYGGPCLPKDVAALNHLAAPVGAPLISAIPWSNRTHLQDLVARALATGNDRFAVLGLSFKPHTSDLRESPAIDVIEALQAAGRDVKVYDPDVPPTLAHDYEPLLATWDELAEWAETWVICKPSMPKMFAGEVIRWM
jgi:GDP-mannose 6-dehydrogenase